MSPFAVQPGQFYYHFKRDANKGLENHAYLIIGVGQDTEDRSKYVVVYKPLYYCEPRKDDETGVSFHVRPYDMFVETVEKPEYTGPRFICIDDKDVIEYLKNTPLYTSQYMDC
jgi:hypothetical protein